jgi:hypothetical protein
VLTLKFVGLSKQHFPSLIVAEINVFLTEKWQSVSHFKIQVEYVLAFLRNICGHVNDINSRVQGKCLLAREIYKNISASRIKLSLFHSQILNNNTCQYLNIQKVFRQYRTGTGRCIRHNEQLRHSLQTYLWTSIRIEHYSEHLIILLEHHTKVLNVLHSLN